MSNVPEFKIAVFEGDGIGPEVTAPCLELLFAAVESYFSDLLSGAAASNTAEGLERVLSLARMLGRYTPRHAQHEGHGDPSGSAHGVPSPSVQRARRSATLTIRVPSIGGACIQSPLTSSTCNPPTES